MSDTLLLSLIVFVPSIAALLLLFVPSKSSDAIKGISLVATAGTFVLTIVLLKDYLTLSSTSHDLVLRAADAMTNALSKDPQPDSHDLVFRYDWIGSANSELTELLGKAAARAETKRVGGISLDDSGVELRLGRNFDSRSGGFCFLRSSSRRLGGSGGDEAEGQHTGDEFTDHMFIGRPQKLCAVGGPVQNGFSRILGAIRSHILQVKSK